MRAQALAIALVIGSGVMLLLIGFTSLDAVRWSQTRFYQQAGFGEVFAELTRAPRDIVGRIGAIDGVDRVDARIRVGARVEVAGFDDPVRAEVVSLPADGQPLVNRLHLRSGRLPDPGRADQVVLNEPFADAHRLYPGDRIGLVLGGRLQSLEVVGVALSPEFVYQIGPADLIPDYRRFGVLWMRETALAPRVDLDGAFNSLAVTVQSGVDPRSVQATLDAVLDGYGGRGSYLRDEQLSHRFVTENQERLAVMAWVLPGVFLAVAAFLVSVLMGRMVQGQRQQIAVLKAFGYGNPTLAAHYGLFAAAIALLGATLGVLLGLWAATGLAGVYAEYFRFPDWEYRLRGELLAIGYCVAVLAALSGAWRAVRVAVREQPAAAMRPPLPERYRPLWLDRAAWIARLGQTSHMVLRHLGRQPIKSALSVLGIALSASLVLLGSVQFGAINELMRIQYTRVLLMDLHLHFADAVDEAALGELRALPGVMYVEGYRSVPVRLSHGLHTERTVLTGQATVSELHRVLDRDQRVVALPAEGLALTRWLADSLRLRLGDLVDVEVLDGRHRGLQVPLSAVVDEPLGGAARMERMALHRLLDEGPALTGAWVLVEPGAEAPVLDALRERPAIMAIGQLREAEAGIRAYFEDTVLVYMAVLLLLAASVAFAVLYNGARTTLAERTRELATLRVLGYTRAEVAWVLIGELLLLALLAIPIGLVIGSALAWMANQAMASDLYRLPFVLSARMHVGAALVVLAALGFAAALVLRRLWRLDMVSALKIE
jgi:putative ABC transport system permease protein